MMVPPAVHLGLRISVLAESEGSSAERAADRVGDYRDPAGKRVFAESLAVVRASGEGYVDYLWQWQDDPGRSRIQGAVPLSQAR